MSEKRFVKDHSYLVNYDKFCILDKVQHKHLYLDEVCEKLNEQQDTITELKSIINFASNEGDLIIILMKELIKLRQEVQECRAYETIEKGVSL